MVSAVALKGLAGWVCWRQPDQGPSTLTDADVATRPRHLSLDCSKVELGLLAATRPGSLNSD